MDKKNYVCVRKILRKEGMIDSSRWTININVVIRSSQDLAVVMQRTRSRWVAVADVQAEKE